MSDPEGGYRPFTDDRLRADAEAALERGVEGPQGYEIITNPYVANLYKVIEEVKSMRHTAGTTTVDGQMMVYAVDEAGFVAFWPFDWHKPVHAWLRVRDEIEGGRWRPKLARVIRSLATKVDR